ncbi:MAG: DUF1772 domain-containing protein [Gammaproteobacteria bacterium]|nr:DUF1772 domain-containing protein [Gammaproteobacteria bacterium]
MKALARVPAAEGIAAMQSINVVVLNWSFLGLFMGTAVVSVLIAIIAVSGWGAPAAPLWLAGAVAYLLGTIAVTAFGNVPLNNRLAAASAVDPETIELWSHYLDRWTQLNTLRTLAATGAALMFVIGLMRQSA